MQFVLGMLPRSLLVWVVAQAIKARAGYEKYVGETEGEFKTEPREGKRSEPR